MTIASVNWDAVGVISSVVLLCTGGIFKVIWRSQDKLGHKLDQVGEHLDKQDTLVDDTRSRVARIEGHLGINGKSRE